MNLEQIQELKKRHDNAVSAMKEAASALNVEGLTDVRKSELEAMDDFYYKTGEEYVNCGNCGYHFHQRYKKLYLFLEFL